MKTILFAVAALVVLSQTASAVVTFNVSPSSVSNTYNGPITLTISNVPTGDTVVVQKFLDANTNGVISPNDLLVEQFRLTDGSNSIIGGVTNLSVPGDLNTTTGAVTASLSYQNGDIVQTLVGRYLYKLSSPSGHFAPLTNSFNVTNFPFPQMFTGTVVSNKTSTVVSNAIVLLFPPPRANDLGHPVAGAVANNAGNYTIMAPPGNYVLMAFKSNFVFNVKASPVLALGSGATVTTNLTLTNASATISGKIVDAANNATVLPGVFMPLETTNGLIASAFSDTNGNFSARVTAGKWQIGSYSWGLIVHGYVGSQNGGTVVNSGVTGVTLGFAKGTGLFYGSVLDSFGNPFPGIAVEAYDNSNSGNGQYQQDGYTDANGNYTVGIVGGLGANDTWVASLDFGTPTNYVFTQSQQSGGYNIAVGGIAQENFTGYLAPNHITGSVKDNNGVPIVGVNVNASANIGGVNYQNSVDTDANGNYSLNVANGDWTVSLNCSGGDDSLSNFGNYACPNGADANITGSDLTVNFVVQICGGVSISTPSPLPVGEVGVYYDQLIQASSCSGNYNWSQTSGTLPGNLFFGSNGSVDELSGYPSANGVFNFTVQVNDGSHTTNRQFSVTISNALQVATASLPNGTNGVSYSWQLLASNGVPFGGVPYSWSVLSGALPPNLNLSTNGIISGTLATSGQTFFTVEATDVLGATSDQPLSINAVNNGNVSPPSLILGSGGGQILLGWPASAGTNFTLQTTTNLANGPWVTVSNAVPAVSFLFTNNKPAAFFRLQ